MYDIGCSANPKHIKYTKEIKTKNILREAQSAHHQTFLKPNETSASNYALVPPALLPREPSADSQLSDEEHKISQKDEIKKFISKELERGKLDHLYVFLSHPDADHINIKRSYPEIRNRKHKESITEPKIIETDFSEETLELVNSLLGVAS